MPRVTLEPVGRFAFLVIGVHAVIGAGLWWWLSHADEELQGSTDQNLVWVSPADFSQAANISPASDASPPPPSPAPVPEKTPEPPTPTTTIAPPPPEPAKVVAAAPKPEPSVASVVPEPKPSAPVPAEEPMEDDLPKAIAIDPAQAAALMARAMANEKAATTPATAPEPKPSAPPAPTPPAPTIAKESPRSVPKPSPSPEPPKPAPVVTPPPPAPVVASSPPPPAPAPQTSDVSRFVTVSHPAPKKEVKDLPKVASLLDIAALDAATTGATGAAKGIRLDEVDRAIIQGVLREWVAPDASKLGLDQRTVSLDVSLDREGRVLHFSLPRHSGSDDLDLSVLEAADRLGKVDIRLPASYPREVYEFQVNFHVE